MVFVTPQEVLAKIKEKKSICNKDLAETLGINHNILTRKLRYLKRFKLVKYERIGHYVFYSVNEE